MKHPFIALFVGGIVVAGIVASPGTLTFTAAQPAQPVAQTSETQCER